MPSFFSVFAAACLLGLLASPAAAQPSVTAQVALDPGLPAYRPGPVVGGSIVATTGMDSIEQTFRAWVDAFRVYNPGARISIVQRDVAPEERIGFGADTDEVFRPGNEAYEDKYGYEPFRVRICQGAFVLKSHVSAIGVFVSKANPIDRIKLDQLDAIFSDARRRFYSSDITTWGQLGIGGSWADKPIHLYGFYWRDDVTANFREMVLHGAPFKAGYRVPGEGMTRRTPVVAAAIMEALSSDPYGIGFANFSYATDGVKALALEDEHGVIAQPVLGDMASGRYPLQRSLYIYVNRRPGTKLSPLVREFLSFVLSREGQALVSRDHYLPLTAAMVAAERARLE